MEIWHILRTYFVPFRAGSPFRWGLGVVDVVAGADSAVNSSGWRYIGMLIGDGLEED